VRLPVDWLKQSSCSQLIVWINEGIWLQPVLYIVAVVEKFEICLYAPINRFNKCSVNSKLALFKSFCMNMYGLALWKHYSVTVFSKLKSCYHKCIKKFFGFKRMDSMSGILIELSLASINTVVHNSKLLFDYRCANTCNAIAKWFYKYWCVLLLLCVAWLYCVDVFMYILFYCTFFFISYGLCLK